MDTKPCRSCREEINVVATKCPRCQAFQSRWTPWLYVLSAMIPLMVMLPLMLFPLWRLRSDSPDVQFKDVKHQLTVTNAMLKYEAPPVEEGVTVHYFRRNAWVYCTIKNDSGYRWDALECLVTFENDNGERIDLNNVTASVTSQPNSELDFRIACELAVDPDEVCSTKVTVTDAKRPYR